MIVQALNHLASQGSRCRDLLQQIGIHFQFLSLRDNHRQTNGYWGIDCGLSALQ
ncbi:MAG: hypothetical protein ACOH1I_04470 [Gallionellaceae bacterium]